MIPIILVSKDKKKSNDFLKKFIENNQIRKQFVFTISPQGKEFAINQIRELKKQVIFDIKDIHLYILEDFDRASYEAQNAFLKTLEEHNKNLQFILVVKNYRVLLPTVISRSKLKILEDRYDAPDKKISAQLDKIIADGEIKILKSPDFQSSEKNPPSGILDQVIYFFRSRLTEDPMASRIIKETLQTRFMIENNNINPQLAIDHILLFIRKAYLT